MTFVRHAATGSFLDGLRHGAGKLKSSTGDTYEGVWKDDVLEGQVGDAPRQHTFLAARTSPRLLRARTVVARARMSQGSSEEDEQSACAGNAFTPIACAPHR